MSVSRAGSLRSGLAVLVVLFTSGLALAIGPEPAFEDPALEAEYQALIREVRCLVCQNQSIADSTAPLAADLRREIRELMANGADRDEVARFLVDRYGDFVLYRPPVQPSTYALWGAPLFFCALGLLVFVRTVRKRLRQPIGEDLPGQ